MVALSKSRTCIGVENPLKEIWVKFKEIWVKFENQQTTNSFKDRGAYVRLSKLSDEQKNTGVIAMSAGNHAQGVAWAAKRLGIQATIVMPRDAPKVKLENTKALGAEVVLYERPGEDRDEVAAKLLEERGGTLVHAFGDPWVIEGQGSAGVELTQQIGLGGPSRVIACCGGGGLAAGLGLACPEAAIHVVEPVGWDVVGQSIAVGELVHAGDDAPKTICDALQPTATKALNLDLLPFTARDVIATVTLVFSQFAVGGGREDRQSRLITGLAELYPGDPATACGLWRDIRQATDPERPNTTDVSFATQSPPAIVRRSAFL